MPRRPLLAITLALLLLGSAHAEGDATENVAPAFSVLSNTTLTCSARLPAAVIGCYVERPLLVLGSFEAAIAVDAAFAYGDPQGTYLAPMLSLAWYGETASVWVEVTLPADALPVPHLGRGDWARIGFSYRWPP